MSLIDLALRVHEHLDVAGIPHAFGGALALGYVAEPRGTVDIDLNVFVTAEPSAGQVMRMLAAVALLAVGSTMKVTASKASSARPSRSTSCAQRSWGPASKVQFSSRVVSAATSVP